ncbi:MAG TPA: hypothetical protein VFW38_03350 [Solirubrobacteraceae bacterium]|nr:hypothetical protein [Solirubrobacteraceae bacterium]
MSSPIQPIGPLGSPGRSEPTRSTVARGGDFESHLRRSADAGETSTQCPPPELLEEIALAARTNDRLRASGQNVAFIQDEHSGKLTIELRGGDGSVLRTLSVSEALDLAAGKQPF